MREELSSIVRETAIEVLGPVMRTATKSAAKYAVRKAPEMAMERVLPKLRELQSTVQDAGGVGAFARDTLGSESEGGGLSKLKQLGREAMRTVTKPPSASRSRNRSMWPPR